ncbi:hypothetical protein [Tsuneonella dongtanensis]|uniref:hypothetical protein n=1 Tax=Tsuneonella dongtanensis TaxID=692370 RepID=UPI0012ECF6C6|nr:hypothetical protein [Tsuneonella dongtanensis]
MFQASINNIIPSAERKPVAWKIACMAIGLSLSLTACATDNPSRNTGERLSDRGAKIGAYGTAWTEGQSTVQDARKAIEKSDRNRAEAERDLDRAREQLAEAEQKISDASATRSAALRRIEDGRAQMTRAEADYATTKAGPSVVRP